MNGAHFHLLLNHFPMIGLTFSIVLLAWGMWGSNCGIIRSGLLIAFISGALTIPTYLTGEPAEKTIKESAGFSESLVEEHEDAALFAISAMIITGLAAGAGLYFSLKKNHIPKPLMTAILVLNLFTMTVIARTNYLGGQISHPEIRDVKAQPADTD